MRKLPLALCSVSLLTAADLPVKQVVLFKHGVAFYERSADLKPGDAVRLQFKATEMNDVLKSLTVVDRSGAKVSGVRYDASSPIEEKLAEFPFHIDGQMLLAAFLDQNRGAAVELRVGTETLTGRIVSARATQIDEKIVRESMTILTNAGELRTFELSTLLSIRFLDPDVQSQLSAYLSAANSARSRDKRSVFIDAPNAQGLSARYMVPAPVWKSSYRLLLGAKGEPTLEGWAIVDNTTGEDWNKVALSLVSGRPISFISRLYEPRLINRPTADLPEEVAQAPRLYEAEVAKSAPAGLAGGVVGGILGGRAATPPPPPPPQAARKYSAAESVEVSAVAPSSAGVDTTSSAIGELFEYRFSTPVTVKQNESAMLPFLQQAVSARKLLIFANESDGHPRNAAEITNNTGKTLDGGPITVFDGGIYAGEGLIETAKAGDQRLIGYAIDQGTRVTTQFNSGEGVIREIHAKNGILTLRLALQQTTNYTVRNAEQKAKTLLIEHAALNGYKLLSPKPVSTTSRYYRFEVTVPADSTSDLPVVQEHLVDESNAISNINSSLLLSYLSGNRPLSAAARQQLQQIAKLKEQLAETSASLNRVSSEIASLDQDQSRIRQNISSLNAVNGQQEQVQRYAGQLAAQEVSLARLRDQQTQLRQQQARLQSDVNAAIVKADF